MQAELIAAQEAIANNPVVSGTAPDGPAQPGQANPHAGAGSSIADKAMAAAGLSSEQGAEA
jgi:hypothetical protein